MYKRNSVWWPLSQALTSPPLCVSSEAKDTISPLPQECLCPGMRARVPSRALSLAYCTSLFLLCVYKVALGRKVEELRGL